MRSRAVAELLTEQLRANIVALSGYAGVPVLLPVKANAYGHGLSNVTTVLADLKEIWGFAVATPEEAVQLVDLKIKKPIFLLTPADPSEMQELTELGVRFALTSQEAAQHLPQQARVHLKVNTGMNRLGIRPDEAVELAKQLQSTGQLEGIYTHFASADQVEAESAQRQLQLFNNVLDALGAKKDHILAHASNSAGVLHFGKQAAFDLIRPGLAAYGFSPAPHLSSITELLALRPALRVRAQITFVATIQKGDAVSYGETWRAPRETTIAAIGFGYADGYPRRASNQAKILVKGEQRAVLGRICMDQCLIDVTGLTVQPGDWVEVYGQDSITAQDVADWADQSIYEVLTGLGERVERTL